MCYKFRSNMDSIIGCGPVQRRLDPDSWSQCPACCGPSPSDVLLVRPKTGPGRGNNRPIERNENFFLVLTNLQCEAVYLKTQSARYEEVLVFFSPVNH